MSTRRPSVAGTFYPAAPEALAGAVRACIATARVDPVAAKAIVAPHAGLAFSGPVAGSAYAGVAHLACQVTRVVLIGPSHRMRFSGVAVPSATAFATPIGTIPIDATALQRVLSLPAVQTLDQAFDNEHALEVELPFIQTLFPAASVVPLLVGDAMVDDVERILEELWGGPETLIVVSSDLSHFHDYDTARTLDLATSQAVEAIMPAKLDSRHACGHLAIAGLLRRAAKIDLRATTHDLRNSGDTQAGRDRVVGYGAYAFEYAHSARLSDRHRDQLMEAAYKTLSHLREKGRPPDVAAASFAMPLRAVRKTFVTLEIDGRVRGCVGSLVPVNPLITDIVANTYKAAMKDSRVPPMTPEELAKAKVTIAILSHPRSIPFATETDLVEELRPEVDGLVLHDQSRRALFLPKVWNEVPQPKDFLRELKRKAGLPPDPLSPQTKAFRFVTESFNG